MKIKFTIIIILLFTLNVNANKHYTDSLTIEIESISNQDIKYDKLIEYANKHMATETEFTLDCAYKAHELAINSNNIQKQAESSILMGDIFCHAHSYPTAISYYEEAIKNLKQLNKHKEISKLYIKISELYKDSNFDTKWCIEAIKKAEKYASIANDKYLQIETYSSCGNLYLSQGFDSIAGTYYDKVLSYPIEVKTIRHIARALTGKANIELRKSNYVKAMNLIDSSTYLCIRDFYDNLLVKNYGYKAEIYDSINNTEDAQKYYLQAIKLAYSIDDFDNCGQYMLNLGILNEKLNDYDSAIEIFEMLRDSTEDFKMYELCYKSYFNLSRCYATQERYEEAYEMLKYYNVYYDSANIVKQEKKINELRTSYILSLNINELNAKELELEEIKHKKYNLTLTIIATICISILLISYTILHSRNKILKKENSDKEYRQQLELNEMSNKMMEMQLKNNKESLINLALHLKSFIEFITPLKNELKEAIELPDRELKEKVKSIYQNMQNNFILYNNMNMLHNQIDEIYKDFLNRLEQKYPTITKAEKRLCMMLYINMSSKEIAVITNTTLRSVETSRYRLRRKFNLTRDDDMVSFLKQI